MKRVAFFLHDAGGDWLGGLNYFHNLVTALREHERARIEPIVFAAPDISASALRGFGDIEVIHTRLLGTRSVAGLLLRTAARSGRLDGRLLLPLLRHNGIDLLSHDGPLPSGAAVRSLGWIPDFQHQYLRSFFPAAELRRRNRNFRRLARDCDALVVSSEAARGDLQRFAPEAVEKTHVLHFSPRVIPGPAPSTLPQLQASYDFVGPYFHLPNQFWAHKNHKVVVDALAEMARTAEPPLVLATGRTHDYRNPTHYLDLIARVEGLGLSQNFRSLGVVPYSDMVSLMRHAKAVINPSLFEGWSTTVEEAKAYGKTIVLSDLEVHREQAPPRGVFFDPQSPTCLAKALRALETTEVDEGSVDFVLHEQRRRTFASTYADIVERVCSR